MASQVPASRSARRWARDTPGPYALQCLPDANTLFNIAERLSGSFGIALLATLYATRTHATGSPVTALHDCALALTALCAAGALAALALRGRPGWPGRDRGPCPPAADRATMVSAASDAG